MDVKSSTKLFFNFCFLLLLTTRPGIALANEICDNGIDDDENGLIDLNDPACDCELIDLQSMIPNPSFEDYDCCPEKEGDMECASDWIQPSLATSDYMNLCGYIGFGFHEPPFPLVDGGACVRIINGNSVPQGSTEKQAYKEYVGACLNYPMAKDSNYILEFYVGFLTPRISPDVNISIFCANECSHLPFNLESSEGSECPSKYPDWYELESQLVSSEFSNEWVKVRMEIDPFFDVSAIVVGPDCELYEGENAFYFLDHFTLYEESKFDFELIDSNSICSPEFRFEVKNAANSSYQWYKEGIALIGETNPRLISMHGEGQYQLRITDGSNCRVSEKYIYNIPFYNESITLSICEGEDFFFIGESLSSSGIYRDTSISENDCDTIKTLNLMVFSKATDTVDVEISQGTSYEFHGAFYDREGSHSVLLETIAGCDSLVVLNLTFSEVYIPNVFSPNEDGNNDIFRIFYNPGEVKEHTISIYDKWGNLMFQGQEWDGMQGSKLTTQGIYTYRIDLTNSQDQQVMYVGSLTLIR